MLALLLAMGGAWAQGPTVTELTVPDNWNGDYTTLTAADLPGFVAVDSATADQWEDAPTTGSAILIYGFTTDGSAKLVYLEPGDKEWATFSYARNSVYGLHGNSVQFFYTTGGGVIKLTPDATGKVWTLDETPDYDLDLNVVYYQKYALKEIPTNWQVKVDGVDKTAAIDGDSLKISETAQVLLTPDHPEYVKSVRLLDVAGPQTLIVAKGSTELSGNKELYYITGDTYRQALARPENQSGNDLGWGFWESSDLTTIYFKEVSNTAWDMAIDSDYNFAPGMGTCAITLDSVIDPNHAFQFVAAQ